jgi:uncharacterized membrane-anchored protein YhcB (DUF1043 family)
MDIEPGVLEIALGIGLLVVGVLLGRWTSRGASPLRARIRELEGLLAEERERRSAYEAAVGKHFEQTSGLFRDLTQQYTALYAHLAEASRELCADRQIPLGRGFHAPGLSPREASPAAEPTPAAEAAAEDPSEAGR